jgi:hypothetical protein
MSSVLEMVPMEAMRINFGMKTKIGEATISNLHAIFVLLESAF